MRDDRAAIYKLGVWPAHAIIAIGVVLDKVVYRVNVDSFTHRCLPAPGESRSPSTR